MHKTTKSQNKKEIEKERKKEKKYIYITYI